MDNGILVIRVQSLQNMQVHSSTPPQCRAVYQAPTHVYRVTAKSVALQNLIKNLPLTFLTG